MGSPARRRQVTYRNYEINYERGYTDSLDVGRVPGHIIPSSPPSPITRKQTEELPITPFKWPNILINITENSCMLLIMNDKYFLSFLTTCSCLLHYKSYFKLLFLKLNNKDLVKYLDF